MEQKKPIILQVDESTKKMISELESTFSEGFSDALEELKGKINSSFDAIESLKAKLNRINDIQDSNDESSSKSDEIKHGVENLIKVVSSQLNVDIEKCASDDPLDKQATKGDVENSVHESLKNLEILKDFLSEHLLNYEERHSDSFTNLSALIDTIKLSISTIQEKQAAISSDVTSDFKKIVETIEVLSSLGKEHVSNSEEKIKDSVIQTYSNIRQHFEDSQAERKSQFEENQSALQSQSIQLSQNTETLHTILESLSASFKEADERLSILADSFAVSYKSNSDQMRASFDSSQDGIKSEFAHLNATISENEKKLIAETKETIDNITNVLLGAKSEILSNNDEKVSQTLSSIKNLYEFLDARVSSIEKGCAEISNEVITLSKSIASEVSIIKENQEHIQNTLTEVLFHSIPFWRFKARKAVKQNNKQ